MCTTAVAIVIGLLVANLFKGVFPELSTADAMYEAKSANLMDTIVNIFPSNMWSAFFNANMLQVIVIALAFGAGILVTGEAAKPVVVLALNKTGDKVLRYYSLPPEVRTHEVDEALYVRIPDMSSPIEIH